MVWGLRDLPRTIASLIVKTKDLRVQIRLPGTMTREVDRIVREHPELNYNRQQFVESAVRKKIEHIKMLEGTKILRQIYARGESSGACVSTVTSSESHKRERILNRDRSQ